MFGAFWEGPNGLTGVPLGSISRSQFWGRFRWSLGRFGIPRAISLGAPGEHFGSPLWCRRLAPERRLCALRCYSNWVPLGQSSQIAFSHLFGKERGRRGWQETMRCCPRQSIATLRYHQRAVCPQRDTCALHWARSAMGTSRTTRG